MPIPMRTNPENQMVVDGDHAHSFEQESGASDQKEWTSYSAVKRAIFKPVGEAADRHGEKASEPLTTHGEDANRLR